MMNPLFLQFCLWRLFDSKKYLAIQNTERVCSILQSSICAEISPIRQLNLPKMVKQYPALKVDDACIRNDKIGLQFFEEMLKPFHKSLSVRTQHNKTLSWIITVMPSVLKSSKHIQTEEGLNIITSSDDFVTVLCFVPEGLKTMNAILERSQYRSVYVISLFYTTSEILQALPSSIQKNAKSIYLVGKRDNNECEYSTKLSAIIPLSHEIRNLSLVDQIVDQKAVSVLGQMAREGNLSNLTQLNFTRCGGLKSKIGLASSCLPHLTHLCLYKCQLNSDDYIALSSAIVTKKLPRLDTIILPIHNDEIPARTLVKYACLNVRNVFLNICFEKYSNANLGVLFKESMEWGSEWKLETLGFSHKINCLDNRVLRNIRIKSLAVVYVRSIFALNQIFVNFFGSTSRLDISHLNLSQSSGISGNLSDLLCEDVSSLETLILRGCDLTQNDLSSLVQANFQGKLSALKHLDLSKNENLKAADMFDGFSKWAQLRSFNIMDTSDRFKDEMNFVRVMSMGCLSTVTEIGVSGNHISEEMTTLLVHLETLRISGYVNRRALLHISNAVSGSENRLYCGGSREM